MVGERGGREESGRSEGKRGGRRAVRERKRRDRLCKYELVSTNISPPFETSKIRTERFLENEQLRLGEESPQNPRPPSLTVAERDEREVEQRRHL